MDAEIRRRVLTRYRAGARFFQAPMAKSIMRTPVMTTPIIL
jgi:hypothetical protein